MPSFSTGIENCSITQPLKMGPQWVAMRQRNNIMGSPILQEVISTGWGKKNKKSPELWAALKLRFFVCLIRVFLSNHFNYITSVPFLSHFHVGLWYKVQRVRAVDGLSSALVMYLQICGYKG